MSMNEFFVGTIVIFIVVFGGAYFLKQKWELPKETRYYSGVHRRIHNTVTAIGIVLLIVGTFWAIENNFMYHGAFVILPMFIILEMIRLYMLKKYEENTKWMVISAIQLFGICLIFVLLIAATGVWSYTLG